MNKIKNHFSTKKNYYIVAGFITLLLSIMYLCFGAWPFNNGTIAHYDLYHQIVPFLELIFDAIEGRSTLIYSNYVAGGANIVGYFSYFIFNPFYLILLLFGSGNIWYGINIVFILHIIAIAVVFLWFIRKYFKLSSTLQILFAISYALSPYVLFNYTFFTWLMLPLLLPILVHFFIRIIQGRGFVGFTIVSTAMIFNCYGIGLCGHIPLYALFSIFTFTLVSKSRRKDVMVKILLAYGLSVCVSLFMLGPNALQLGESSRMDSTFGNLFTGKLFGNVIYGTHYLLINAILLTFTIIFFIKFKTDSKVSQFLLISLILCIIPIFIDTITLMLCLGSYFGYNMRLGYILTFVMFVSTIYTIKNINREHAKNTNAKVEKSTQNLITFLFVISIIVAIVVAILVFELLSFILSHASARMYTWGFVALMFVPITTLLVITTLKYAKGKFTHKFFTRIFIAVFCFQTIIPMAIFTGEGVYDTTSMMYLAEQSEHLNTDSRIKGVYNSLGTNLHLASNFSSMSGSASQIHKNAVEFGKLFGYYNHHNIVTSDGGTMLADAFMGYDYFYSAIPLDRPYLVKLDCIIADNKPLYIYKNTLSLNNAILVNKNNTYNCTDNVIQNTQNLYEYLGGSGNIFVTHNVDTLIQNHLITGENISINNDSISIINEDEKGVISFDILPSNYDKILYMSFAKDHTMDFIINTEPIEPAVNTRQLYDMGFIEKDNAYSYQITIKKTIDFDDMVLYELNYDLVESLLMSLKNQSVDFEFTKTGYNINVVSNNQKLVVTNANISGNHITVNNKEVTTSDLPFIEIELDNGENYIESRYVYPYTTIFVICLVFGILSIIAVIIINKYFLNRPKFKNFLYYTSLVAFGGVLVLIYFVPSVIFVVRLCLFKF